MADKFDAANPTGSVRYVDPEGLHKNPAFTNAVVVEGPARTVYVGGQDSVDASGSIVGKGDVAAQTEQVLANVRAALVRSDRYRCRFRHRTFRHQTLRPRGPSRRGDRTLASDRRRRATPGSVARAGGAWRGPEEQDLP